MANRFLPHARSILKLPPSLSNENDEDRLEEEVVTLEQ